MFLDEKLNDSRSYDEFYNDLEINLIGELKSNISPKPKLSPIHDPECMTSEIGNLNKSENTSLNIFLKKSVYQAINIHAKNDTSREVGGILLGGYYQCENTDNTFLEIKEFIIAKHTESGGAHLTFTHNTWNEINREKDEKYPDLNIVGWYHTHPSFGVFLSGHDRFIQTQYFNEDWQVAYVVDPIRQKRGFLRLKDKNIVNYDGFYLYSNIIEQLPIMVKFEEIIKEAIDPQFIRQVINDSFEKMQPIKKWNIKNFAIISSSIILAALVFWNIYSSNKIVSTKTEQLQRSVDNLSSISNKLNAKVDQIGQLIPSNPPGRLLINPDIEYVIQEADALSAICKRYYNIKSKYIFERVAAYNNINDFNKIYVGQKIFLPSVDKLFQNIKRE